MNNLQPLTRPALEVLIVEDSATQAQRLAYILEQNGYAAMPAANGRLALEAIRRRRPDLIISDIVMPEMDGYELCAAVKADAELRDIPFILVTTLAEPADVIRGLECGADNFILKPYDDQFLTARVQLALAKRGRHRPATPEVATEIVFDGKQYIITAGHSQILDLLVSIYDSATRRNKELAAAERALRALNSNLDRLVVERTEELREATRRHLALLGNLQGMAYRRRCDGDRGLEFVSEGCRALLGVAPADLTNLRKSFIDLVHPDDLVRIRRKTLENLAARVPNEYEYRLRHADGSWRWVWEKSHAIYDAAGKALAIEGFVTDVTDRLKLAEQLRESQRMDAIGRLTGGLAHDLNNYLAVLIGNLDLLADRPHVDPETPRHIEGAIGGALRGAELTRSLLAFSRRQPLDPKVLDPGERVAEVVKLLRRTIGEKIVIELDAAAGLWPVEVDGAQLDSCVLNLANNTRDAMPGGGKLTISVRNVAAGEDGAPIGDHVLIEFADNGSGMTPEIMAQVFEPFFTTKGPGHGTGLGLSMVHGFVHQSGGAIRLTSILGTGTTVRIYLPRATRAAVAAAVTPSRPGPVGGGESVLVVDDNEQVRAAAAAQLVALGYRVTQVENGDAALALLEAGTGRFDLIFTDLVMPGRLDGYELAQVVLARWPGKKVLMTSGSWSRAGEAPEPLRNVTMLHKPYRKLELARAVVAALAA